jgi:Calx-beta domain/FG-GAP-like repeat
VPAFLPPTARAIRRPLPSQFQSGRELSRRPRSAGVATADFNNDAILDLATTNPTGNTVSVLLGNGDGTFLPARSSAIGDSPATIVVGDFNADGNMDVATGNSMNYEVSILLGLGDGTFQPPTAYMANAIGAGSILEDEPRISVSSASILEGNSGTRPMTFTVTLSVPYDQPVSVNYTTMDGSATAGEDYVITSGMLTFAPGETTKTITVVIKGDKTKEQDEVFNVYLSGASSNAVFPAWGYFAAGTILNDDGPPRRW